MFILFCGAICKAQNLAFKRDSFTMNGLYNCCLRNYTVLSKSLKHYYRKGNITIKKNENCFIDMIKRQFQ